MKSIWDRNLPMKSAARFRGAVTQKLEPGTRNPKPEARNPKPETRNPKPET